jgi:hypothetical protein
MEPNKLPRALSHDEQHAAEAAFSGRPFNPKWSMRAREVYEGIVKLLPASSISEGAALPVDGSQAQVEIQAPETLEVPHASAKSEPEHGSEKAGEILTKIPYQRAIEAGALIDVTPTARQLGLAFPVTVTKPLWELGIAPTGEITQDEQAGRLRDVLMAFRLRLTAQPTIAPIIDFPALLSFPPGAVPQPIPLFALIQPDEEHKAIVTLLLPNEVAATIVPMN